MNYNCYIVSNIWWIFISLQKFYINVNKLFIKLQSNFLSSFKLDRATFLVLQWSPFVLLTQSHKNNLLSRQFEFALFAATNFGFRKILWLKIETTCCRKVFTVLCSVLRMAQCLTFNIISDWESVFSTEDHYWWLLPTGALAGCCCIHWMSGRRRNHRQMCWTLQTPETKQVKLRVNKYFNNIFS